MPCLKLKKDQCRTMAAHWTGTTSDWHFDSASTYIIIVPVKLAHLAKDLLCGRLRELLVEEPADVLMHRWSFLLHLHLRLRRVAVVVGVLDHRRVATIQVKCCLLTHHNILKMTTHLNGFCFSTVDGLRCSSSILAYN